MGKRKHEGEGGEEEELWAAKKKKRKGKKEKKEKKDNKKDKRKKSEHKDKKKRKKEKEKKGGSGRKVGRLKLKKTPADLLQESLLDLIKGHPNMTNEIGIVLATIQEGGGVSLDGVKDKAFRASLESFLNRCKLNVEDNKEEGTRTYCLTEEEEKKTTAELLKRVIDGLDRILAPTLGDVGKVLGDLLATYPALKEELPALLNQVTSGRVLVVEGLEDQDLKKGLIMFLESLKLVIKEEDGEEGYALPRLGKQEAKKAVVEVLNFLGEEYISDEEAASSSDEEGPAKRRVGPVMPDAATLAAAQAKTKAMMEEEDNEDDFGPTLESVAKAPAPRPVVRKEVKKSDREEWMTILPEGPSIAEKADPMKARGFQQHSWRGKLNNVYNAKRTMSAEEQARIEAEEKETRGKTLLEVHQEKMKTGAAAAKPKVAGKKAHSGWNRDRDLLTGRKLDANAAKQLFEKAQELASRFARTR